MPSAKLGALCDIQSGGTPSRINRAFFGGTIPWAKIADLDRADGLVAATEESITQQGLEAIGDRLFSTGTILLAMYGSVGKVAVAGMALATNQAILGIRIRDRQALEPRYLLRWLESIKPNLVFGARGVTQQNISATIVRNLTIPLPPLTEQRRIAAVLDMADAVRQKRRESMQMLDDFSRSVFLEMFGDPTGNERAWDVVTAGSLFADLRYGTSVKCATTAWEASIPVLRIPNIVGGEIAWDDLKYAHLRTAEVASLLLRSGDLLFVRTNGNPEHIGRCAVFDGSRPALFASYLIRGRLKEDSPYRALFLKYVVSNPSYHARLVTESRTTAGNYNISAAGLRRLPLILPPLSLQDQFLELAERTKHQRGLIGQSVFHGDQLFHSLASRFWGQPVAARG